MTLTITAVLLGGRDRIDDKVFNTPPQARCTIDSRPTRPVEPPCTNASSYPSTAVSRPLAG